MRHSTRKLVSPVLTLLVVSPTKLVNFHKIAGMFKLASFHSAALRGIKIKPNIFTGKGFLYCTGNPKIFQFLG